MGGPAGGKDGDGRAPTLWVTDHGRGSVRWKIRSLSCVVGALPSLVSLLASRHLHSGQRGFVAGLRAEERPDPTSPREDWSPPCGFASLATILLDPVPGSRFDIPAAGSGLPGA